MLKTLLVATVGGIALWKWAGAQQRKAVSNAKPAKPHEVTAWEGEGGALRSSGAQLGPSPQTP